MNDPISTASDAGCVENAPGKEANGLLSRGTLSLLDQAIVSGTNFLTTVLVGRAAGESELGLYSLAFTVVVMLLGIQESLVTLPYTVFSRRIDSDRRPELLGTIFLHQIGLSVLAAAFLCAISGAILYFVVDPSFGHLMLMLGITSFAMMLRDFVRRVAFAELRLRTAIVLDAIVCAVQLTGVVVLAETGRLSAVSTHGWCGLACAVATVIVLLISRPNVSFVMAEVPETTRAHWHFGQWVLLGQMTGIANGYLMHWLIAFMLGSAQAGVFAACMTLVFFANPFVIGVGNILAPTLSTAVAERGNRSIRRPVIFATLLLSMSLGSMFVVVFLWGNELLGMLFGDRFANYGDVAAIIALGILLRAVGVAPENGLRAMDFPFATFSSQIVTLAVSSSSALLLIPSLGIQGGAYAFVLGSAFGNIVRWMLFWRYSDREVVR